ncbi:MAG: pyrimidine 5'-nucleotidase [Alphaproteobacteria bacterium]|nr:pyrimidine 5'-nucleotidase [Alphaproteobacteria bacterium]
MNFATTSTNFVNLLHVDNWVFDLDNTLYPATCDLFAGIDARIQEFVARTLQLPPDEARRVQKDFYAKHGTTLNGLMKVHGLQPDEFLDFVHDIDLSPLDLAPDIAAELAALPGRRYIFTNGSLRHAEQVTRRMKIDHLFDGMIDIAASGFTPKHEPAAHDRFLESTGIDPAKSTMFEDLARNLVPAHEKGFTTILVRSTKDWSREPDGARPAGPGDHPPHVHHVADDLAQFLGTARVKRADAA